MGQSGSLIPGDFNFMTTTGRSTFVTTLAWIFIALGTMSTLMAVIQAIVLTLVFPIDGLPATLSKRGTTLPWGMAFLFEHLRLFLLCSLFVSVATLAASIGLLKRWNWARLLFVAVMIIGIAWNFASLVFSLAFASWIPVQSSSGNAFEGQFELMTKIGMGFNVLVAIGVSVLFGWIIKRLVSQPIRSEFS